jgi:hypothetical protein
MGNGNAISRIPILGIILVLAGAGLLLDELHLLDFGWEKVLWLAVALLGALLTFRAFANNEQGRIFFGTVLFLFGVLFLLRSFDIVHRGAHVFWPAILVIIGMAFLMLYINNTREWALLFPAVLFVGLGAVFMLAELNYLCYWDVWDAVRQYWPVVLILIGMAMILERAVRKKA